MVPSAYDGINRQLLSDVIYPGCRCPYQACSEIRIFMSREILLNYWGRLGPPRPVFQKKRAFLIVYAKQRFPKNVKSFHLETLRQKKSGFLGNPKSIPATNHLTQYEQDLHFRCDGDWKLTFVLLTQSQIYALLFFLILLKIFLAALPQLYFIYQRFPLAEHQKKLVKLWYLASQFWNRTYI